MSGWAAQEFATADLGDKRLNERLVKILDRLAANPTASLKSALQGWSEVMGGYRFFDHAQCTVSNLLRPHQEATLERVKMMEQVLAVQDTTELDYTHLQQLKGKGYLSDLNRQGFFAHTQLMVTPEGLPLGVWRTEIWARDNEQHGKAERRKQRPLEEKESFRWLAGYRDACSLAEQSPQTQVISCADREGDLFEIFQQWQDRVQANQPYAQWLIRSHQDRALSRDPAEEWQAAYRTIHETIAAAEVLGVVEVAIESKEQSKKVKGNRVRTKRSVRKAELEVRATCVSLRPPYRAGQKLQPVTITVVRATEKNPPAEEDPIDWILLTSLPAANFEEARLILDLYLKRWTIEVFHRVLKTGCRVEELQLKEAHRINAALALYMVVAWRVLYLLILGRDCPELPADVFLDEEEWQTVLILKHGAKAFPLLHKAPPLGEMVSLIAQLGGYLARKHDGPPGAQAFWQGLAKVRVATLVWKATKEREASPP